MSTDNKEIEIRFSLTENEFSGLRERLASVTKLRDFMKQKDVYFTPHHRDFVATKTPNEWFSIRRRGKKAILNYKHWYPENMHERTYCDEFEAEISNAENVEKILDSLNFRKLVTVEKERETFIYNDEIEICLDSVKGLGHFVEIEAKKIFGTVEDTREKLLEFANYLGIDISKMEKYGGYAFLMMKKMGLIK